MATGVAHGLLRCVFNGCIAASDMEIKKRPYHKNCGCAFHHRSKAGTSTSLCNKKTVSYPIRRCLSSRGLQVSQSDFDQYCSRGVMIMTRSSGVDDCFVGRHSLS